MAECRIKRNSRRAVKVSKKLANLPNSGVTRCELDREFVLSWHQAANLKQSIHEIIDRSMHQYFQEAGGILLAYDKVQWLQRAAVVYGSDPGICVKVRVRYYVFRPSVDALLSGKVAFVTSSHVACKVYGIVSARISFAAEDASSYRTGEPIWFRVRRYRAHHRYIMLDGVAVSKEDAKANGCTYPYGCKVNILAKAQQLKNSQNNLSSSFSIPMLPFPKAPNGKTPSLPGSSRESCASSIISPSSSSSDRSIVQNAPECRFNGGSKVAGKMVHSLTLTNGVQDGVDVPLNVMSRKKEKRLKVAQTSAGSIVPDSPTLTKRIKSEYL